MLKRMYEIELTDHFYFEDFDVDKYDFNLQVNIKRNINLRILKGSKVFLLLDDTENRIDNKILFIHDGDIITISNIRNLSYTPIKALNPGMAKDIYEIIEYYSKVDNLKVYPNKEFLDIRKIDFGSESDDYSVYSYRRA